MHYSKCVLLLLFYCRFYRRALGASNVANTLMIEGVQSYHAGQYQCFATSDGNNCLTFFSLNATLTIIGEFKIPLNSVTLHVVTIETFYSYDTHV